MATKKSDPDEPKTVVFINVPKPDKPICTARVFVSQDGAIIENGQTVKSEETDLLSPSGFGCYMWDDDHPNHKRRLVAMKQRQKKVNIGETDSLLGPFDSVEDAQKKMHEVREKAPEEEVTALKATGAMKDAEIAELKKKLAAVSNPAK